MRACLYAALLWVAGPLWACDIELTDLSGALAKTAGAPALLATARTDPRSGEPVRRYILDYGDAALYLLEEQSCSISNLRLTVMSPEDGLRPEDIDRIAAILNVAPIWRAEFASVDIAAALGPDGAGAALVKRASAGEAEFTLVLDDRISARTDASSALLNVMRSEPFSGQFVSVTTLVLSVGGL